MRKSDSDEPKNPAEERRRRADERLASAAKFGRRTTPSELAELIGLTVVGQDDAVRRVAVQVHHHLITRVERASCGLPVVSPVRLRPTAIVGPSGCGKSSIFARIAQVTGLICISPNLAQTSETAYYGISVEDHLGECLRLAGNHVPLAECSVAMWDEWDKKAKSPHMWGRDAAGEGVQSGLLRVLDGGQVQIPVQAMEQSGGGRGVSYRTFNCHNLLCFLAGAFEGIEEIVGDRLAGRRRIGFGAGPSCDVRNMTAEQLRGQITVDDLIAYGIGEQCAARIGQVIVMPPLSESAMRRVLCDVIDGPIQTAQTVAAKQGWKLHFPEALIRVIVREAMASRGGARSLFPLVAKVTERPFYEMPDVIRKMGRRFIHGHTHVQLRSDSLTSGYYAVTHENPMETGDLVEPTSAPTRRTRAARAG